MLIAKKLSGLLLLSGFVCMSAQAQERQILQKTGEVKGYWKRDRAFLGSQQLVIPSQYHEVYGYRVDAGIEYTDTDARFSGETANISSPKMMARGVLGGDILTLGLGAALERSLAVNNGNIAVEEDQVSRKLLPLVSATITENITVGLASEFNWIGIDQTQSSAAGIGTNEYGLYTRREAISVSFHTPKMEVGLAYVTPWDASDRDKSPNANVSSTYGLVAQNSADTREVYLPGHYTAFARGNLTNNISIQGALSHVQYDDNAEAAKAFLTPYRREDRIAAQFQGVYWLNDHFTRLAATLTYRGATYAPFGVEENALGYRDANLYGAAVDASVPILERTYLGLGAGYLRGERDQNYDAGTQRVMAREEKAHFTTNFSKTF